RRIEEAPRAGASCPGSPGEGIDVGRGADAGPPHSAMGRPHAAVSRFRPAPHAPRSAHGGDSSRSGNDRTCGTDSARKPRSRRQPRRRPAVEPPPPVARSIAPPFTIREGNSGSRRDCMSNVADASPPRGWWRVPLELKVLVGLLVIVGGSFVFLELGEAVRDGT